MEKIILETKYVKALFNDETRVYTSIFLSETQNMTDKEWKEQMVELKMLIEKCKPVFIIDDNTYRLYGYSPDMQAWTLDLFVESWNKLGLKKYAQIIPREIVGKLTSDQIEELAIHAFSMQFKHKLVENCKDALDWINELN
jgi:hypothetical protein